MFNFKVQVQLTSPFSTNSLATAVLVLLCRLSKLGVATSPPPEQNKKHRRQLQSKTVELHSRLQAGRHEEG